MSKRFSKKNAQKYVVVHRPHDDPQYYDADANEHILVPVDTPGQKPSSRTNALLEEKPSRARDHVGEAAIYGINFDDSKYDYTQHLNRLVPILPTRSSYRQKRMKVRRRLWMIYLLNQDMWKRKPMHPFFKEV